MNMNINFSYICENNYLLSLCISVVCTLIIFIDDKLSKTKKPYLSYLRHFVIILIAINAVLFIKNKTLKNIETKYDKVKMGEPDF